MLLLFFLSFFFLSHNHVDICFQDYRKRNGKQHLNQERNLQTAASHRAAVEQESESIVRSPPKPQPPPDAIPLNSKWYGRSRDFMTSILVVGQNSSLLTGQASQRKAAKSYQVSWCALHHGSFSIFFKFLFSLVKRPTAIFERRGQWGRD